jgi:hypothetical protein
MPILRRRLPSFAIALLAAVAAAVPARAQAEADESPVVREARAFMDAYAHDLRTADREGIAARYDRRGAYFMFSGHRQVEQWNAIRENYRTQWTAPGAFQWADLIYEPAGPDAVVVNGYFLWTRQEGGDPLRFSYTALLKRQDGVLRIRLEDESMDAMSSSGPAEAEP